jgi:peptidoglycan/xylan/chitin deacetylase (PgdA/CDA1 family)
MDGHREEYVLSSLQECWGRYAHPSRLDPAEIVYIKQMLQHVLPAELRSRIARELFEKYVTLEEAAFARELYMITDQLSVMQSCGMYVGSHGVSHQWLDKLSVEQQAAEVDGSLAFLRDVGSPVDEYSVMCFPYGVWNQRLLETLRRRKCSFGLTTEVAVADLDSCDPLLLPRLDTNDLPKERARVS